MRLVLGEARYCMVELDERLLYVEDHGEVELAALIITVEVNAKVALSFPIVGYGVMLLEDGHEVLRMIFAAIFYSKVVNAKRESDWVSAMCPETGGKCNLPIYFQV